MAVPHRIPYVWLIAGVLAVVSFGCDAFVSETELPIGTVGDEQLSTEAQVPFLIRGVEARFATVYTRVALYSGGLSDEIFFDTRLRNAYDPDFGEIDAGQVSLDNSVNELTFRLIGELHFVSNDLLRRLESLSSADESLAEEARYVATFHRALVPYFLATYYGLSETNGGGVLSEDPGSPGGFFPSDELYRIAVERLEGALEFADPLQARIINTLIARIELYRGRYPDARAAAESGMVEGDPAFESQHGTDHADLWFVQNQWYAQAGGGIHQWAVDFRFRDVIDADPMESSRIPLMESMGVDTPPTTFYIQNLYTSPDAPMPFVTWEENELMLAELDLRDGDSGTALQRINRVRSDHGLEHLTSADMPTLIRERELELWTMGLRLPDQRRFGLWHLGPDTWQYLPIPQSERTSNPNL